MRSLISHSDLPEPFWGEALKTIIYLNNRIPCKAAPETPYKRWTRRNPSLNHPHVWECSTEAKLYNSDIKKLEPKTFSCKFVGYSERSKSFRFYCPSRHTKIIETDAAKFIENDYNDGSMVHREVAFEEKNDNNPKIL